jgi:DNA-binding response OmpR family regulator
VKILIIDDDRVLVDVLKDALSAEGFEIIVAFDGLSGIESVITQEPDMIVLDIRLPGIDGFEVCRKLKESPATAAMPVVILSGAGSPEYVSKALAIGIDDFIHKPFDASAMGARLRGIAHKRAK